MNAIIQIFKIQVAEIKKNARNVLEKKKKRWPEKYFIIFGEGEKKHRNLFLLKYSRTSLVCLFCEAEFCGKL